MQAPPGDGSPTRDALSREQTPSDWYAQGHRQGIQLIGQSSVFKTFGQYSHATPLYEAARYFSCLLRQSRL
ncbi:MAG: hypothetical protein IJQ81_06295 [Oscillibacter sp.]|nr:hypothetical protein [Oscillibacter sp.]